MGRRAARVLGSMATIAVVVLLGTLGGVAWAGFTSARTASQQLATLQLQPVASASAAATATTATACTSIAVTWSAATGADAYRIQVSVAGGAWTDAIAETGTVTTWIDSATYTNVTVAYRVHARDAGSDWEASVAAQTPSLRCGLPPVTGLAATNPCSSTQLGWTASAGATTYDVQRRINGGAWATIVTDQAGTSYADTTVHAPGSAVDYQVRPGVGAGLDGDWSTSATIASWDSFRIVSITGTNSGTLGTLNPGDALAVMFSKPALHASITSTSVTVDNAGGGRGLYPASSTAAGTGIGKLAIAQNKFGASASYAGTITWSGANSIWTWTSTVAGTTMASAFANEAFTPGTGVKCAADSSALVAPVQPTASGRW